ncbi:hypothetical protein [Croceicoccus gelatinilyticus]|uniref:hypothetical protein n=1 Tax=Croceicoccus gelatinilyticus TaxID=2835536 RepID=UPI001BD03A5E|nr:hypothetical protein [Croceicoccus gelatinilyticus]MBS7668148.1 hypothetical protein [Croceicoccus gelatinilyticus]
MGSLPDTIELEGIGELQRDSSRPNCYVAQAPFEERTINLIIHDEQITRVKVDAAAGHFRKMQDVPDLVRDIACDMAGEGLFAKWLFEWGGDETTSLYEWKQGLAIDRIWVMADGRTMVDFAWGQPFADHRVTVSGQAPANLKEAYLSV